MIKDFCHLNCLGFPVMNVDECSSTQHCMYFKWRGKTYRIWCRRLWQIHMRWWVMRCSRLKWEIRVILEAQGYCITYKAALILSLILVIPTPPHTHTHTLSLSLFLHVISWLLTMTNNEGLQLQYDKHTASCLSQHLLSFTPSCTVMYTWVNHWVDMSTHVGPQPSPLLINGFISVMHWTC